MDCEICKLEGFHPGTIPIRFKGFGEETTIGYVPYEKHVHDSNTYTIIFECANGHLTTFSANRICPDCSWKWKDNRAKKRLL